MSQPEPKALPRLSKQGSATRLIVKGKPFLVLGGELGNSSASSAAYMAPHWPRLRAMHLNTVLAPVSWELIEPVEGKFQWDSLDELLEGARKSDLKLILLWFGAWKNSMSTYAPAWVKRDPARFPYARTAEGKAVEILSPSSAATRDAVPRDAGDAPEIPTPFAGANRIRFEGLRRTALSALGALPCRWTAPP